MSTKVEPAINACQPDLWSLLECKRATQGASLKKLQAFVLSLSREQLTHVIGCYLKTALTASNRGDLPLSLRSKAFSEKRDDSINATDHDILTKMNEKYGKKQNKKTLKIIQQNQSKNNHILSMNPEVLAYSLQYLSFRESCKLQNVCSYFVYLKRAYRGLSNYYVNLNKSF